MLRSRNKSLEGFHRVTAWHAAVTINHNGWTRTAVTVDDLLGTSSKIDVLESPESLRELTGGEADGI